MSSHGILESEESWCKQNSRKFTDVHWSDLLKQKHETYCQATPFTAHACKTLGRPTRLPAVQTFWVAGKIAFTPVMILYRSILWTQHMQQANEQNIYKTQWSYKYEQIRGAGLAAKGCWKHKQGKTNGFWGVFGIDCGCCNKERAKNRTRICKLVEDDNCNVWLTWEVLAACNTVWVRDTVWMFLWKTKLQLIASDWPSQTQ